MPSITTYTVDTLIGFMEKVTDSLNGSNNTSWFRGIGNVATYELRPNLYRHPTLKNIDELLELERTMLDRFRERSIMFKHAHMHISDDHELANLVIMQHFGVPTRLLDWTENPFVALYFALTSAHMNYQLAPPAYEQDAAVWILQPEVWNFHARGSRPNDRKVFSLESQALLTYKPQQQGAIDGANLGKPTLAVYGPHNNERVVAQRGTFTLFGADVDIMEDQFTNGSYHQDSLIKIIIPKDEIGSLLKQLAAIGVTDSTVFPDLSGVAKEIARKEGFRL
jgi:hypothetical protein